LLYFTTLWVAEVEQEAWKEGRGSYEFYRFPLLNLWCKITKLKQYGFRNDKLAIMAMAVFDAIDT
jgi:hypothetical protein